MIHHLVHLNLKPNQVFFHAEAVEVKYLIERTAQVFSFFFCFIHREYDIPVLKISLFLTYKSTRESVERKFSSG